MDINFLIITMKNYLQNDLFIDKTICLMKMGYIQSFNACMSLQICIEVMES